MIYVMIKQMSINVMYVQNFGVPDMKVQVGDKGPNAKQTWNNSLLAR